MKELYANNDGKITEEDFTTWYIQSENRISSRVGPVFDFFDTDKSGTITRSKIRFLIETLEPAVTNDDVEEAMAAMYQHGSRDEISFEKFSNWYIHSMVYQRQAQKVEDEMMGIFDSIKPPSRGAGVLEYIKYIFLLPIVVMLGVTVPDVRRPGCHTFCYLSFVLSIMWIGFFSYFMVGELPLFGSCKTMLCFFLTNPLFHVRVGGNNWTHHWNSIGHNWANTVGGWHFCSRFSHQRDCS
jgi:hypothetical protein